MASFLSHCVEPCGHVVGLLVIPYAGYLDTLQDVVTVKKLKYTLLHANLLMVPMATSQDQFIERNFASRWNQVDSS